MSCILPSHIITWPEYFLYCFKCSRIWYAYYVVYTACYTLNKIEVFVSISYKLLLNFSWHGIIYSSSPLLIFLLFQQLPLTAKKILNVFSNFWILLLLFIYYYFFYCIQPLYIMMEIKLDKSSWSMKVAQC